MRCYRRTFREGRRAFSSLAGGSNTMVLFPGQGSQYLGMGRFLEQNFTYVRDMFQEADEAIGFKLSDTMFKGPEEDLLKTEIAQPATVLNSLATFEFLKREHGLATDGDTLLLGHSLGEIAALTAVGSMTLSTAIKLTHHRGQIMQECCPEGQGAMWVVFQGAEKLQENLTAFEEENDIKISQWDESPETICNIAAINQGKQTVLSGNKQFLSKVVSFLKKKKKVRSISLRVSAAFHSNYMLQGQGKFQQEVESIDFKSPHLNILSTVDGEYLTSTHQISKNLVDQFVKPVLFHQCISESLRKGRRTRFLEVGANSLTPMLEKILVEESIPKETIELNYWKYGEERILK